MGASESTNTAKIDVVLLLIAQKVVSFRSSIVLEPVLRRLCLNAISVRKIAFDLLANVQQFYRSKRKTLVELYLLALKYPNWYLRLEVLRLLALAINVPGDPLPIGGEETILAVAQLLDDDANVVKK